MSRSVEQDQNQVHGPFFNRVVKGWIQEFSKGVRARGLRDASPQWGPGAKPWQGTVANSEISVQFFNVLL